MKVMFISPLPEKYIANRQFNLSYSVGHIFEIARLLPYNDKTAPNTIVLELTVNLMPNLSCIGIYKHELEHFKRIE